MFIAMQELDGSMSGLTDPLRKHAKLDNQIEAQVLWYDYESGCFIDSGLNSNIFLSYGRSICL